MRHSKLCICVRCHAYPEFVLDEVDSIFHYATTMPHVMLAIDRGPNGDTHNQDLIEKQVLMRYPQVQVFKADQQWGWGAGMYGLLCDAIHWAHQRMRFDHFLSLDYDALFVGEGADAAILADAELPGVGLVGTITQMGETWKGLFDRHWAEIMKMTKNVQPVKGWQRFCVYGAVMCLSKPCLDVMESRGYLSGPIRMVKQNARISDDPWLSFLAQVAGFEVRNNSGYCYNVWRLPEDYRLVMNRRPLLKIWHPAKMGPGGRPTNDSAERLCRNYFRRRRGKQSLEKP